MYENLFHYKKWSMKQSYVYKSPNNSNKWVYCTYTIPKYYIMVKHCSKRIELSFKSINLS